MTEEEGDTLAALDFTVTCYHRACEEPASRAMYAYHVAPGGLGWDADDECVPCRLYVCGVHVEHLEGQARRGAVGHLCTVHARRVVVRFGDDLVTPPPAKW